MNKYIHTEINNECCLENIFFENDNSIKKEKI